MSADRRYGDEPERDERAPAASAAPRRSGLSPAAAQLLALQGSAGNRAVCRALASADGRGTTDLVADDRDAGGGSGSAAPPAATPIAVRNGPGHVRSTRRTRPAWRSTSR